MKATNLETIIKCELYKTRLQTSKLRVTEKTSVIETKMEH